LVMVVHGHRQDALGALLPDDVLIELLLDGARRGDVGEGRPGAGAAAFLLVDDRLAQLDALAADVHVAGSLHERADLTVILAAEGAVGVAVAAGPGLGSPTPAACARVFRGHAVSFSGQPGPLGRRGRNSS